MENQVGQTDRQADRQTDGQANREETYSLLRFHERGKYEVNYRKLNQNKNHN